MVKQYIEISNQTSHPRLCHDGVSSGHSVLQISIGPLDYFTKSTR